MIAADTPTSASGVPSAVERAAIDKTPTCGLMPLVVSELVS